MHGHVCRQKRGALELSVLAGICFVEMQNPHFVPTLLILGGRGHLTLIDRCIETKLYYNHSCTHFFEIHMADSKVSCNLARMVRVPSFHTHSATRTMTIIWKGAWINKSIMLQLPWVFGGFTVISLVLRIVEVFLEVCAEPLVSDWRCYLRILVIWFLLVCQL